MWEQISCHSPHPEGGSFTLSLDFPQLFPHPMVTLGPEPWLLMKQGGFKHPFKQKIKLPINEKGGSKKIAFIFLLNTQEEPCIIISGSIFLIYNQWKVCQPCKANTTPCKYYFSKKLPPLKSLIYPLQWHLHHTNQHSTPPQPSRLPALSRQGSDSLQTQARGKPGPRAPGAPRWGRRAQGRSPPPALLGSALNTAELEAERGFSAHSSKRTGCNWSTERTHSRLPLSHLQTLPLLCHCPNPGKTMLALSQGAF